MGKESMDDVLRKALRAEEKPARELNEKLLAGAEKAASKKHLPRGLTLAAGFAMVVVVLGSTVFRGHVKAMVERLFGTITENYVQGNNEKKERAEEEVCRVGESVTRQGIRITLEELLVDANKVVYSVKLRSDERWGTRLSDAGIRSQVFVNGEKLQDTPSAVGLTSDEYTETWVGEVSLNPDMELDGDVEIKIQIQGVGTTPEIKDEWNYKTTVNLNKANSHTMKDMTTTKMKLKNGDMMILHKVISTSTDCRLYITYKPDGALTGDLGFHLDGFDNRGKRVTDSGYSLKKVKGKNEYSMIVRLEGGLDKEVNQLYLAPFYLNPKTYEYRQIGERFTVTLK